MSDGTTKRKIICGSCGECVLASKAKDAYRVTENDGFTRFRDHQIAGSTLTQLCPECYEEWAVETDGLRL